MNMKKIKGVKRPTVKSKSPGATPKSTHDRGLNLGKYLHPAKLPKGSKVGAVVKSIKSSKKGSLNV